MAKNIKSKTAPKSTSKVVTAGLVAVAVLSGFAGAGIANLNAEPALPQINATEAQLATAHAAGVDSVEPVYENVTIEVPVDNGNLDVVLNEIYDNNGKVSYLTEDLDDDEISQIAERVLFINEVKALAVAEAKAEIADLVDKEVVSGETLDEDDIEKIRVDDDVDEVSVDDIDYDNGDATVTVTGTFRQDDVKYDFEVEVEVVDNEVEDIDLTSVSVQ